MAYEPALIIQVPHGSAVARQLEHEPPASITGGQVVVETGGTDAEGNLEALAGEVVLSMPSPETLRREPEQAGRVIAGAGTGEEPLVVVIEAAEELPDSDLRVILEAARHTARPVILRVIREG